MFVARGVLDKKINMGKVEFLKWLNEAEGFLAPQKTVKTWADFQYRKDEISNVRKELEE